MPVLELIHKLTWTNSTHTRTHTRTDTRTDIQICIQKSKNNPKNNHEGILILQILGGGI